jgi:hypothetical protein
MNNGLFILGADDPEMQKIEKILTVLGYSFELGRVNGKRCTRTNAYELDYVETDKDIVFIECEFKETSHFSKKCDHHNVGDYGYELNHEHFLEASSIGQFLKLILINDFKNVVESLKLEKANGSSELDMFFFDENEWKITVKGETVRIHEDIVVIAATDHCSGDMYKGLCKGVNMESILRDRVKAIAKNFSTEESLVKFKFQEYESVFTNLKTGEILDLTHLDLGVGYSLDYLVVREISLIRNIPTAVKSKDHNSTNSKLMMLSLSPKQVEDFLNKKSFNNQKIKKVFGVPTRGYAGGELQ